MELTEIVPRVYHLRVPFSGVFLLLDERITVVDTGPRWSRGRILRAIRELGRDPSEVERIVLTHAHADHFGSLAAFEGDESLERHAHPIAAEVVRRERPAQTAGWRSAELLYHHTLARLLQPRATIDAELVDRQLLPVLGGMRVIETPGHTDGHVALLLEELGVLLSGDALQVKDGALKEPLVFGDATQAQRSVARLGTLEFTTLAPSHFEVQRDEARARVVALAVSMASPSA